ncbi:tRNA synthetases class II (D, K and n) domain-containing protein [Ditylenchus destructor]|uniref:tRNA synthetases class II (D, K and n) domain-containing protein n=1 Tax=Ditylenchus destructor TaxID=166010 RepID=A0AAD4R256_9BILA|nr:tRNA synthetases class II (D, K and n) domain-containing protein [Ditylenchus destructor]
MLGWMCRRFVHSTVTASRLLDRVEPKNDILLQGWVSAYQRHGALHFLKVNDGTCARDVQVVVTKKAFINGLPIVGSAVKVSGDWVKSQGAQQPMELFAKQCEQIGRNNQEKPWLETESSDALRLHLHLRPKHKAFAADRDFHQVDPPLFSLNDCEGAGETFTVKSTNESDFFGEDDPQIYLPVSTQLHLEALASGIQNVYTITPAFRADHTTSRLRLAEFRMLEVECAFMERVDDLCTTVENYVKFIVNDMRQLKDDIQELAILRDVSCRNLLDTIDADRPIPRITFAEASSILRSKGDTDIGPSFSKQQEHTLVEETGGPLFVTRLPADDKPFYMKRTDDQIYVENFELLAPVVGELAGGSVREHDCESIQKRQGGEKTTLDWYLELRQVGYPRSSGFGLGVDRLMQSLFGISNIKDTIAFPRWYKHCTC